MKSAIVEGEPGIFPDPIARLLRVIGRIFTPRRKEAETSTRNVEADEPPTHRPEQR
jgi:hypothetical protein